jgi:predicted DNA-binding antitoxin AbrB/MazE fold protein
MVAPDGLDKAGGKQAIVASGRADLNRRSEARFFDRPVFPSYPSYRQHLIQAIYENGVLRPLQPLDLKKSERVSLRIVQESSVSIEGEVEMSADQRQAINRLLDKMEQMPQVSPNDGCSNRDHDRVIYGLDP